MTELALDGRHVAGLLDDVPAHGVACAVGGFALDAGDGADLVPNGVDGSDAQTAVGVSAGATGQKEGRGVKVLGVRRSLMVKIILDGIEPLAADLVGLDHAAFLLDVEDALFEVDVGEVDPGHGRPSHPRFNQGVDDGPVAVRAVALATGAVRGAAVAVAVFGAPPGLAGKTRWPPTLLPSLTHDGCPDGLCS